MTVFKKCLLLVGMTSSHFAFAGTMGEIIAPSPLFLEASYGYSFPFNEKLKIDVPSNPYPLVVDIQGSTFFAAEIGYRFYPHASFGFETAYRPDYIMKSYDAQDVVGNRNLGSSPAKTLTYIVNGYLNGNNFYGVTPYLTAGIGAASTWLGDINVHNEKTNQPVFYQPRGNKTRFVWQAGAGVNYDLASHIALDLRGRFTEFDRSVSKGFSSSSTDPTDHNLLKYDAFELGLGLIAKCD